MKAQKEKKAPGPEADRLKIKGSWERAMRKAVKKKRPEEGWPAKPTRKSR